MAQGAAFGRLISGAAVVLATVSGSLCAPSLAAEPAVAPPGFTPLFNGRDLTGWHGETTMAPAKWAAMAPDELKLKRAADQESVAAHWRVDPAGEIVNDGQGVYLTTDAAYGEAEFLVDWRIAPGADSAVYLRGTPQVQIWDFADPTKEAAGGAKGSGGLWNNSPGAAGKDPLVRADKPAGEWNRFRIVQLGDKTTVHLNDQLVVDAATMENYWDRKRPLAATGPLQLQTHGGETRWRHLFVRPIPPDEANKRLRGTDPEGFVPVFNGRDLEGWAGAVDNYQVEDGAIVCKPGKGGTLHTTERFGDFVVRFEFQLPPGGNNGLAIRYPGSGDAAYAGMCELQVLDSEHEKYAKLDARQYHGSAYGIAAAHRGYLRPTGAWNYEQVTVRGSTIKVELNGVTILDVDIGPIDTFMANSPHPGKDLKEGFFGFAGHGDPVRFRNVSIRRLDR
jgi:hypothetical protein